MAIEIERKFLVDQQKWIAQEKPEGLFCAQAYLVNEKERNVRVRVLGDKGYFTIKYRLSNISRKEFEYEIPADEALEMIQMSETGPIEKHRYYIREDGHLWEVDVFSGANKGLIVAEIELTSEHQSFTKPDWLGAEVTEDPRYYNASLQKLPYSLWND
ncbi:MAG: CYTH domain-containing protein [Cyclobacteriaceae bacterium]